MVGLSELISDTTLSSMLFARISSTGGLQRMKATNIKSYYQASRIYWKESLYQGMRSYRCSMAISLRMLLTPCNCFSGSSERATALAKNIDENICFHYAETQYARRVRE